MLSFKEFLLEGREGYLYHGTSWLKFSDILKDNSMKAVTEQLKGNLLLTKEVDYSDVSYGVSLTRDYGFAEKWSKKGIIFVLDQRKLAQRHRMIPTDFFSGPGKEHKTRAGQEFEEFVLGSIKNLSKYLVSINISKDIEDSTFLYPQNLKELKKNKHLVNKVVPRLHKKKYTPHETIVKRIENA